MFPSGASKTPNISDDSYECNRLKEIDSPVGDSAIKSSSVPASLAVHFPFLQTYSTRYYQLFSELNAPPVTLTKESQFVNRDCIERSTSAGSSPD